MRDDNILDALNALSPAQLDYQEWCSVGMALKQEGYPSEVWEDWSRADSRYHPGECRKKWESFRGNGTPITGATIVKLAMDYGGYRPPVRDDERILLGRAAEDAAEDRRRVCRRSGAVSG